MDFMLVTKSEVWKGLSLRIAFGSILCLSRNLMVPTMTLIRKLGVAVSRWANLSVPLLAARLLLASMASSIF